MQRRRADSFCRCIQFPERRAAPVLCDAEAARMAANRASRIGVPFRVALPTYGCELFFNRSGHVVEVRAEQSSGPPPEGATQRIVLHTDASEMAGLARKWKANPPPGMTGVIWYRLPTDNERYNWRWERSRQSSKDGRHPLAGR